MYIFFFSEKEGGTVSALWKRSDPNASGSYPVVLLAQKTRPHMKAVALKGPKNTFSRKQAHQQEACLCSSLV